MDILLPAYSKCLWLGAHSGPDHIAPANVLRALPVGEWPPLSFKKHEENFLVLCDYMLHRNVRAGDYNLFGTGNEFKESDKL